MAAKPRITGLSHHDTITCHHFLDVCEEHIDSQWLIRLAFQRLAFRSKDPLVVLIRIGVLLNPLSQFSLVLHHQTSECRPISHSHTLRLDDDGLSLLEEE